MKVGKDGTGQTTLVAAALALPPAAGYGTIAIDATHVYWLETGSTSSVWRLPK